MAETLQEKLKTLSRVMEEIPEIRYAGDPVLRMPTQPVELAEGVAIGKQLGEVLMQYRQVTGLGRGLAAPQIGLSKSVFVIFVDETLKIFINPKVVERSRETNFYRESCISVGVMSVDVERPERIVFGWTDIDGTKHEEKFNGFMARLLQHEEAHLRGLLNIDEALPQGIQFNEDPAKEQLRAIR